MKITILDGGTVTQNDLSWHALKELGDVVIYDFTAPDEVVNRLADTDIALTNKVVIDREIMSQLPRLRYVGVLATGYNVVDVAAARSFGITVTNVPAYSTNSVAQMVFAHLLNVVNGVGRYAESNRKGRWSMQRDFCYVDTPQREIASMSLGIVGLGNIGRKVADIAHAFGMKVYAATSKTAAELPDFITKCQLEQLYAVADVLTLHCPATDDTMRMIRKETINKMRDGVIIINTGRGTLIDEHAVADAVREGKIEAYCTDVMTQEPPAAGNDLLATDGVYSTPHIAWATREARQRLIDTVVQNVKSFIEGHAVNVV